MEIFDIASEPKLFMHENLSSGYKLSYPSNLLDRIPDSLNFSIPIDDSGPFYPNPGLSYSLPIKYCSLSGECQPTTLNFAIITGQLELTQTQLLKTPIAKSLTKLLVGDNTVYQYQEGAEGEGIIYNFVLNESAGPQTSPKIFVVALKYLDETVVATYARQKSFIKFSEQKEITNKLIKSLEFSIPINQ
jgi:hypothetical protein